ncbi:MAG: serine/threonine protein kinase [Nannocystales bacterium]
MGSRGQAPPVDARTLSPGTRLGRYVLSHRVARGGMAELYLAKAVGAEGFHKTVALKLVLPHLKDDASFMEMFRHEASLSAQLDHPNIGQVFDLGFDRGEYFIAMEYVHGRNVASLTAKAESIPLDCALSIVAGACDALSYAHDLPADGGKRVTIVHRDVSPGNVLVRFDGIVKLVDFGIAKALSGTQHTRTGTIKGKAGYMSPEQCRGLPLDRRSDVYCIGIMLYELTTGQRAFAGHSDFSIMNAIISGDYTGPRELDPQFPLQLADVIARALAVDRDDRFETTADIREALDDFAANEGLTIGPAPLRGFLQDLLGDVPLPELQIEATSPGAPEETEVVEPGSVPTPAPHTAPSGAGRVLSYVAVAAAAASIAAYWAWTPAPPVAQLTPAPTVTPEQGEPPVSVAASPTVEQQGRVSASEPVDSPAATAADPAAVRAEDPTAAPEAARKRASRRRPKKRSTTKPTTDPVKPASTDNDLRPPSLRH